MIIYIEVEKILKEVKASFVNKLALATNVAPYLYIEVATKGRLYITFKELRVYLYTIYKVTFRVLATNTKAYSLTLA